MADATDLKSVENFLVWVRLPRFGLSNLSLADEATVFYTVLREFESLRLDYSILGEWYSCSHCESSGFFCIYLLRNNLWRPPR